MKITDASTLLIPAGDSSMLTVAIDTDEGLTGLGEIGIRSWPKAAAGLLADVRDQLIGVDAGRIEHLWQLLARGGFFPADRLVSAVVSAIDIALWDIQAQALGVPLHRLLGGTVRDHLSGYTHVRPESMDTAAVVDGCLRLVADGWRHLRLVVPSDGDTFEPRRAMRTAIEQFHAARAAVGPDIELILDVHTRLDQPEAVTLCREIESARPYFVEDPLRCEDLNAYDRLRSRSTVPLAAGEQIGSKWGFRQLIEHDLIDHARIDLGIVGGLTEARKIAGWCETHHIRIAPHNPLGPLSTAAAVHFGLTCPNLSVQEMPNPVLVVPDGILEDPVRLDRGRLTIADRSGLGVRLDRARLAEWAGTVRSPQPPPLLRHEDGSFTNW